MYRVKNDSVGDCGWSLVFRLTRHDVRSADIVPISERRNTHMLFWYLGDGIWDHEMPIRFGGISLWHRMTILQLSSGGLVVHSPTKLDSATRQAFQNLSPIVAIIAPSWSHDLYLREYLTAYPGARLYGAPALARWNRSLPFAEVLGDFVRQSLRVSSLTCI